MARGNPSTTNSTRRSGSFSGTRPSGRTWYCTVQGIPASRNSSPASPPTGEVSDPHYFFSISDMALTQRPWRSGVVYLLPAGSFETQPPLAVGDVRVQVAQAASPVPVAPVAKLRLTQVTSLSLRRYAVTMTNYSKHASLQIPLGSPGSRNTQANSGSGNLGTMTDSPEWITLAAYENVAGCPMPAAWVRA
jgi:hypothetical protein